MTWPRWLRRAVKNRHRHAIEQASRRWRGGRRDDSARPRRKILISTQVLREVRERPGRDDNHKDELDRLERRMLDEHFFLYNDVPDTGMWRQSDAVWKATGASGARSSGEEPASPRRRAGVASIFDFHTGRTLGELSSSRAAVYVKIKERDSQDSSARRRRTRASRTTSTRSCRRRTRWSAGSTST